MGQQGWSVVEEPNGWTRVADQTPAYPVATRTLFGGGQHSGLDSDEPSTFETTVRPALEAMAHPGTHGEGAIETAGELAGFAIPGGAPSVARYVRDVGKITAQAASEAPKMRIFGTPIPNPVRMFQNGVRIVNEDMPAERAARANRMGVERYAPNASGYTGAPAAADIELPPTMRGPMPSFHPQPEGQAFPLPETQSAPSVAPKPAMEISADPTAEELAQAMRNEWGAESASRVNSGRIDYGNAATAKARADIIRRLAPGESRLPDAARRAVEQHLRTLAPEQAWDYISRAPNSPMRDYYISLMRGK